MTDYAAVKKNEEDFWHNFQNILLTENNIALMSIHPSCKKVYHLHVRKKGIEENLLLAAN